MSDTIYAFTGDQLEAVLSRVSRFDAAIVREVLNSDAAHKLRVTPSPKASDATDHHVPRLPPLEQP